MEEAVITGAPEPFRQYMLQYTPQEFGGVLSDGMELFALAVFILEGLDFPDFARHQMSYIVTSTRGVYEQRQTVYPRV